MKRNGFTLIELLGVVTILSVLILILFPIVLNQIKKSKKEISEANKILIIDATKDYMEANNNNYEKTNGVSYCIDINSLGEYLIDIKDENLNEIDKTKKIKVTYNSNYDYEIVDSCTTYNITLDPNGGTNGISEKTVAEGSKYGNMGTPLREGKVFLGWFLDDETTEITSESIVTEDATVYAHWAN